MRSEEYHNGCLLVCCFLQDQGSHKEIQELLAQHDEDFDTDY